MKIAVAMSGGVDSSAAAQLLLNTGHEIVGFTMRQFDDKRFGYEEHAGIEQAIRDARKVADFLGIEHHVIDLRDKFDEIVVKQFVEEYKSARTPNPCTLCNPTIKWGAFLNAILELGADKVATGHYARILEEDGIFYLQEGIDKGKDQTYMLWGLSQEQLARTMFPVGTMTKDEIRKLAILAGLPVASKKDSQEICFIPGKYQDFLKQEIMMEPGDIVLPNGKVIGKHFGLPLYTIGQRKGLNTPWSDPLYVLKLDARKNRVIVTDNPDDLLQDKFYISDVNWFGKRPRDLKDVTVQIRYNSAPVKVESLAKKGPVFEVVMAKAKKAITPGQSAVFYRGETLIGGGIIR